VNYLLDTNAVVALLRDKPPVVRERFRTAEQAGDYLAVSSVVLFELWYGVEKSTHVTENTERLRVFLSGDLDVLAFDDKDAKSAGRVRATLEEHETMIGPYDLLIAGQALARGLTVVSANASEFARVQGLGWVDWTRQPSKHR
jgi:tRNA(fMet)-specific endonuclease VapC